MVFNTGKLSSSIVIETMVMAVQALDKSIPVSGFNTSEIAEDAVLDKAVKKLLKS